MLPLLHLPKRAATEIKDYIGTLETESLEFKEKLDDTYDLAKELASFANNQGGELIIGIARKGDRASHFCYISESGLATVHQGVTQALDFLRPVDFKLSVRFDPVPIAPDQNVFAISVPPSGDLVGVQRDSAMRFPIRVGSHTKYFEYEEVMQKSRAAARTMRLRLLHLEQQLAPGIYVRISSPLLTVSDLGLVDLPTREFRQGRLVSLEPDTIRLSMVGHKSFLARERPGGTAFNTFEIPPDNELQLPYGLIREAWIEKSGNSPYLCVALDGASVVWNGEAWRVIVGG